MLEGRKREAQGELRARRGKHVKKALMIIGVLAVMGGIAYLAYRIQGPERARLAAAGNLPANVVFTSAGGRPVNVTITSDPPDATVTFSHRSVGRTPVTVQVDAERSYSYSVVADEPYEDYRLYKAFNGNLTATNTTTVSVWIDRTTAEEQAAARQAAEEGRRAAQEARKAQEQARKEAQARAEREQCLQRARQTQIVIEDWSWYKDRLGDYAVAEGRVVNNTTATLRYVKVMIEYFTSSKSFITSDWTYLQLTDLLPGQSSPFKLYTNANPAMATASIRFVDRNGSQLSSSERSALTCP